LETQATPKLRLTRLLATSVTFPGAAPVLAWPSGGQAAVEVEGIGDLGSHGVGAPVPIASVAKVMVAYLILRDHPLALGASGPSLTVTAADVAEEQSRLALGESVIPVQDGEQLTELQALQALLVPSANNVATILARFDAGGQAAFLAKMNATAHSLGLTHTTYTDPSGFDATTVSTATDQLRLGQLAMTDPVLAQIVAMPTVTLPVAGTVKNYDALAGKNGFIGIKTGSDSISGGCFLFANRQTVAGRSVTILGVVLGQRQGPIIQAALNSAQTLVTSVTHSIRQATVLPAGTVVAQATSADGHQIKAVTTTAFSQIGWAGLTAPLDVALAAPGTTLKQGQPVATVHIGGSVPATSTATATATMPKLPLRWRLHHLF
jgi:D-alanyl-D-alanine carboxypeptidase (penicillin-binding protein 5/6)